MTVPMVTLGYMKVLTESCHQDWRQSTVFNGVRENLSEKRSSVQCTIKNEELFDIAETILSRFVRGPFQGSRLLRGHVDYIISNPCDFFVPHCDFELFAGEGVQSLTMIICLVAPESGGELMLREKSERRPTPFAEDCTIEALASLG